MCGANIDGKRYARIRCGSNGRAIVEWMGERGRSFDDSDDVIAARHLLSRHLLNGQRETTRDNETPTASGKEWIGNDTRANGFSKPIDRSIRAERALERREIISQLKE